MKTEFHTVDEILKSKMDEGGLCPLNLAVIPNYMGINLCAVEGLSWTRQDDGQLVSLTIYFVPGKRTAKKTRRVGKRHR